MEVNHVSLAAVAVRPEQYPTDFLPEIVFVGKSNVGKSSLINAMINRKALARTSQNPGKTRTINFYNVEEKLFFVDLPGYGYAKASKTETEKWGAMIESYLLNRKMIKCILLLIDIRHEPSANDIIMYDWLMHYQYPVIIVMTKADKVKRSALQKNGSVIRKSLGMDHDGTLIPFSSETKQGKLELWEIIESMAGISD